MKKHSKIISLIVALLLALVLWAYTVTYISPETTKEYSDIPVRFTAEDVLEGRGLVLTDGRTQTVDLTIRGNRKDLAKLNSDNIKITANLGSVTEAGENQKVSYTISYPDTVAGGDLAVEKKSVETLTITTEVANSKTLYIAVSTEGKLPEGYLLENAEAEVDSVFVFGPAEEINRISKAEVSVDVTGIDTSETIHDLEFRFYDEAGKEVELSALCDVEVKRYAEDEAAGNVISVHLDILPYRDLQLTATRKGLPEGYEIVDIKITPESIRVTGNKDDLDGLKAQMEIEVDYSMAEKNGNTWTIQCPINPPKEGINIHDEETIATVIVTVKPIETEKDADREES
ncbi:MAG: CdaR family protein [Clostridia bacterium]|nr:CdaR family protein [Clostridia bacterium]